MASSQEKNTKTKQNVPPPRGAAQPTNLYIKTIASCFVVDLHHWQPDVRPITQQSVLMRDKQHIGILDGERCVFQITTESRLRLQFNVLFRMSEKIYFAAVRSKEAIEGKLGCGTTYIASQS